MSGYDLAEDPQTSPGSPEGTPGLSAFQGPSGLDSCLGHAC